MQRGRHWVQVGVVSVPFLMGCGSKSHDPQAPEMAGGSSAAGVSGGATSAGGGGSSGGGSSGGGSSGELAIHCDPSAKSCSCLSDAEHTWGPASTGGACPPDTWSPRALCCAQAGYPASSVASCNCNSFTCSETTELCSCAIGGTGMQAACAKTWATCCMGAGAYCTCDDVHTQCPAGETRVASCTLDTMRCEHPSDTRVTSCSSLAGDGAGGASGAGGMGGIAGGSGAGSAGAAGANGTESCVDGAVGSCGEKLGAKGACAAGTTTCKGAHWGACSVSPAAFDACLIGNDAMCTGVPVSNVVSQIGFVMPNPASTGLPNAASYVTNADDTVTDHLTGLTWSRTIDPENRYPYAQAAAACAAKGSNWRLPSRLELVSLVDVSVKPPTINHAYFPDTPLFWFWSSSPSTTYMPAGDLVDVQFNDGMTGGGGPTRLLVARCVSVAAPKCYPSRFRIEPTGFVRDVASGLTWQRDVKNVPAMNFAAAKTYCATLGNGWRLPSLNELQTIQDETRKDPAIDPVAFPDTPSEFFYVSTPVLDVDWAAWSIDFAYTGTAQGDGKFTGRVRCVR